MPQPQYFQGLWHSFFFSTVKDGKISRLDIKSNSVSFLNKEGWGTQTFSSAFLTLQRHFYLFPDFTIDLYPRVFPPEYQSNISFSALIASVYTYSSIPAIIPVATGAITELERNPSRLKILDICTSMIGHSRISSAS